MMPAFKDLRGMRFGKLVVINLLGRKSLNGGRFWECRCDCGNMSDVGSTNLVSGGTKSCGCTQKVDPNRQSKRCPDCCRELPISEFGKKKGTVDNRQYKCKSCSSSEVRKYYSRANKDKKDKHRVAHNTNLSGRYKSDIRYKITVTLRNRINVALKRNSKSAKTLDLLGCPIEYLKSHLESKFDGKMSWDNHGSYWHIDHIKPCASFDLSNENEQKQCFHYTNLQPLEKIANIRKGDKYAEN